MSEINLSDESPVREVDRDRVIVVNFHELVVLLDANLDTKPIRGWLRISEMVFRVEVVPRLA
jgi:hypothetical protein